MNQIIAELSISLSPILAQARSNDLQPDRILGSEGGTFLLNIGKAILFFVVGWIIASIVKSLIVNILKRTNIDNQIAGWLGGQRAEAYPVERWIASLVYWVSLLFAIVAALQALGLESVSQPLNSLLEQFTSFLPKIVGAAALLGIAWIIASLVKSVLIRVFQGFRLDERLGEQVSGNQLSLSETIANAVYWLIFLLFLPSILSTLQLAGTLGPVQRLLDQILGALPNIFQAILIGAVGWFIAQLVRRIVTNLLAATGIDRIGDRFGLSTGANRQSLSSIIGTIVYVLVLIPAVVSALNALQIRAISEPAINMLDQVMNLLPKLFAAGVIIAIAYVAGQFVSELVTNILTGIGFNNLFEWLGIAGGRTVRRESYSPGTEQPTVLQGDSVTTKTPSELVGAIAQIAVILVATLTAVDILQIQALRSVVGVIMVIAGQILLGLVVFAIGLYLANLAYNLIASSGTRQAKLLGQTARVSIIVLISAMALQQMGVATNIVNLAFGLLVGGIAVAIALAFGLGGRDVAGEQLREWLTSFKRG
ncbi:MAG: mechanosensitive ion channel [Xenococcaceae cyanobacterium]